MKTATIKLALAFLVGTSGIAGTANAQNYPNQSSDPSMRHDRGTSSDDRSRSDQGMRRDDQGRHDDGARADRRDDRGRYDRRSWRQSRHCRTVWYHHRSVRKCW